MQSRIRAIAGLSAILTMAGVLAVAPSAGAETPSGIERAYQYVLAPLNGSGVAGSATVSVVDDEVTVTVRATGVARDLPHAMHLHGTSEPGTCPPASADTSGDGLVSTIEGVPFYGAVRTSLTTAGDTSAASALAVDRFPTAPDGTIDYERTFRVPEDVLHDLAGFHVVVHGIDLDGSGAYDGAAPSSLDPSLPLEATIPAACGEGAPATTSVVTGLLSPLNGSEVTGAVTAWATGSRVTVTLVAEGVAGGLPHAMHLHGGDAGQGVCPPPSADADGDGLISTAEGVPFYGAVQTSLTTSGDTSAGSALAVDRFPTAPDGTISYSRTFEAPTVAAGLADLHVVVHGADLDRSGAYDGAAPSSLDPSLPLEATLPVTCGTLDGRTTGAAAVEFDLGELNGSGVTGRAQVVRTGSTFTVNVWGRGAAPGLPHAMHLHGGPATMRVCPPPAADTSGDGLVDTAEGVPFYGAVQTSLTTSGDTSAGSALAVDRFPSAPDGTIAYSRTFTVPPEVAAGLADLHVVVHGIDLDGSGAYDGAAPSSLDPSLPLEATIPAACGEGTPRATDALWLVGSDGGVFALGSAQFSGSLGATPPGADVVDVAVLPSGDGYWFVGSDGGVFAFGSAPFLGSAAASGVGDVAGMALTPTGDGYWIVTRSGAVLTFGDAEHHGDAATLPLNQPIVDLTPTASGDGYWLVAADGGIFAYGDAAFHGSAATLPLNQPVIGMTLDPTGNGYLLFASDGGVFAYGASSFVGSTGGITTDTPVVDVVPTGTGQGYWVITGAGMVYGFGDAVQVGQLAGVGLNGMIVGGSAG